MLRVGGVCTFRLRWLILGSGGGCEVDLMDLRAGGVVVGWMSV